MANSLNEVCLQGIMVIAQVFIIYKYPVQDDEHNYHDSLHLHLLDSLRGNWVFFRSRVYLSVSFQGSTLMVAN